MSLHNYNSYNHIASPITTNKTFDHDSVGSSMMVKIVMESTIVECGLLSTVVIKPS